MKPSWTWTSFALSRSKRRVRRREQNSRLTEVLRTTHNRFSWILSARLHFSHGLSRAWVGRELSARASKPSWTRRSSRASRGASHRCAAESRTLGEVENGNLQGYLTHKKKTSSSDPPRTLALQEEHAVESGTLGVIYLLALSSKGLANWK